MDQKAFYEAKLAYEIDAYDLNAKRENGDKVFVLDARSHEAFTEEHIPGAISLPHRKMSKATTAQIDRNALIVTYCDGIGCNASTKGALRMLGLGFIVRELQVGLVWWKQDVYPKVAGS